MNMAAILAETAKGHAAASLAEAVRSGAVERQCPKLAAAVRQHKMEILSLLAAHDISGAWALVHQDPDGDIDAADRVAETRRIKRWLAAALLKIENERRETAAETPASRTIDEIKRSLARLKWSGETGRAMAIEDCFTENGAAQLRELLADHPDREFMAAGRLDSTGTRVAWLMLLAGGDETSVIFDPYEVADFDVQLHTHPTGNLWPSKLDRACAAELLQQFGVQSWLVAGDRVMKITAGEPRFTHPDNETD